MSSAADRELSLGVGDLVGDGRFELLRPLDEGGVGTVWLAHDRLATDQAQAEVAVKLLIDRYVGRPERAKRLQNEAAYLERLRGKPGIVQLLAQGEATDAGQPRPWYAMELLQGQTLDWLLVSGNLERGPVLDIAAQIARALLACHEAGIVHRDTTADNVYVDRVETGEAVGTDGAPHYRVKLFDFSHAASLDAPAVRAGAAGRLTTTMDVLGTVGYMSPEQVWQAPPSPKSDSWGFGALLYRLATRQEPYKSYSREAFIDAQRADALPALRFNPVVHGLPEALAQLVLDCTARDLGQRPAMPQILQRLEAMAGELPPASTPSSTGSPAANPEPAASTAQRLGAWNASAPAQPPAPAELLPPVNQAVDQAAEPAVEPAVEQAVEPAAGILASHEPLHEPAQPDSEPVLAFARSPEQRAAEASTTQGVVEAEPGETPNAEPVAEPVAAPVEREPAPGTQPDPPPKTPKAVPPLADQSEPVEAEQPPRRAWLPLLLLLLLGGGLAVAWALGAWERDEPPTPVAEPDRDLGPAPDGDGALADDGPNHGPGPGEPADSDDAAMVAVAETGEPATGDEAGHEAGADAGDDAATGDSDGPAPSAAPDPEPATPAPAAKPSRPKPTGPGDKPNCAALTREVDEATTNRDWQRVLTLTQAKNRACWSKRERTRLRVEAHFSLGQSLRCVEAGKGSSDPQTQQFVSLCQNQL